MILSAPCSVNFTSVSCLFKLIEHYIAEKSSCLISSKLAWKSFLWPFFLSSLVWPLLPYTVCSISPCICAPSLFTIKVLTRLFQVERLHKSFSFSLLPLFILWGEAECVLEGSIPWQPHRCFSSSHLRPLSFLSSPSVSSDIYFHGLDVCMHPSKTSFCWQLCDCQSVAYLFYCHITLSNIWNNYDS